MSSTQRRWPDLRLLAGAATLIVLLLVLVSASDDDDGGDRPVDPGEPVPTTGSTEPAPTTTTEAHPAAPPTPPPGPVPDPTDPLVIVDRERHFDAAYRPADLVEAPIHWAPGQDPERRMMRATAAAAGAEVFAAAEADGVGLLGISAYRSHGAQATIHARSITENAAANRDDPDRAAEAELYTAAPGHSEHQSGLALDVTGVDGICVLEPCFADRPEAVWLEGNVHRFGFIVRYPAGAEDLTGYAYEPWHLRHVGVDLATRLHEEGITLDEWAGTVEGR